jgi:hypothetical protein
MAMIFELVINAGPDRATAEHLAEQLSGLPPLPAGRHRVPLGPPEIRSVRGGDGSEYQEVSLAAAGVGHWRMSDGKAERFDLDVAELSELGRGLYEVLRGCRGYRAAFVGWNPEDLVDLAELDQEWAEELRDGSLHGLVLATEALASFRGPVLVEPFAPGFSWMPYRGQRSADSTAG